MANYVFPPAPQAAVPVRGSDQLYAVSRIFCVGRNYAAHAREMGSDPTREPPFYFNKAPADLVASAEQSERVALGRYKAGVGTILDVLSAQAALASARLQRIQAQLDWNVYRATLAQSVGALDYTLLQAAAEGRP